MKKPKFLLPPIMMNSVVVPGIAKWRPRKRISIQAWMEYIELLIAIHSSEPHKRGKFKGHGETHWQWVLALAAMMARYNDLQIKGKMVDGNIALANNLGLMLLTWSLSITRAKAYDPRRPLSIRRRSLKGRQKWIALLLDVINDDKLMSRVWKTQPYNIPYGKQAKGGKFI